MTDFLVRKMKPAWSRSMMQIGEIDYRLSEVSVTNACGCSDSVCYFEARSVLPEALQLELGRALSGRLVDDGAGGLTLERAVREIDETLREGASDAEGLLADYRTYLVGRMALVTNFRAKQFAI